MSNFLSITVVSLALIVGTVTAYSPARTNVASASATSAAPPPPTSASLGLAMRAPAATRAAPETSTEVADTAEAAEAAQARRRAVERRRTEARQSDPSEREQAARLPAGFVGLLLIAGSGSRRP